VERLRWILTAALSAYACYLAVQHATPIDQALPFLAVIVTVVAWVSYPAVMLAVPLLIVAEISFFDEGTRLLALGAVMAAAFAVSLQFIPRVDAGSPVTPQAGGPQATPSPLHRRSRVYARDKVVLAIAAILVLRWIPLDHVRIGRELFLLALCVTIVFVLGRTPFAVLVAVAVALFTPAIPLRTLALPLIVLFVATLARAFGMPRIVLIWPSSVALAFLMLFFAWSGIVARAFPYFFKAPRPEAERILWQESLGPNRSATYEVPQGARSLIVSGANVAKLRRGALLGRIEPGGIAVRIGDAADWGYLRRDHFYGTRNPLPRDPAGKIRGYGYEAWLDGAGRVPLPRGARVIRVTAAAELPADALLQVEGFE